MLGTVPPWFSRQSPQHRQGLPSVCYEADLESFGPTLPHLCHGADKTCLPPEGAKQSVRVVHGDSCEVPWGWAR